MMKTSKQDMHDLLSQLAADIEEIKAMLNSNSGAVGTIVSADVVADTGMSGKRNAISNDVAVGDGLTTANADCIIAEINRMLEPITQTCGKLPDRIKSYYAQLLLRIPQDLREELARDNDARKRKGLPTVEEKIDNSLTLLVSIYNRLHQLEDAILPDMQRQRKGEQTQATNGKFAKSGIIARLQSAWLSVKRLWIKWPMRRCRKPYILCTISICLLYFVLSIFSWKQWHHYRDENTRLRLSADKYRVDSIILREVYPQAAITLSGYEHITKTEGPEAAIQIFWERTDEIRTQSLSPL